MPRDVSRATFASLALSALCFLGCGHQPPSRNTGSGAGQLSGRLIPPAGIAQEDGQWLTAAKDYASTRFSGLDQITTQNVASLKVAWTFSTGLTAGHEGAPLVAGSTMYLVTPFPNILYALDLTQPGAALKWSYHPKPAAAAKGVACCDQVNRGAAFYNGRIYYNSLDGHAIAVDAGSGKEV